MRRNHPFYTSYEEEHYQHFLDLKLYEAVNADEPDPAAIAGWLDAGANPHAELDGLGVENIASDIPHDTILHLAADTLPKSAFRPFLEHADHIDWSIEDELGNTPIMCLMDNLDPDETLVHAAITCNQIPLRCFDKGKVKIFGNERMTESERVEQRQRPYWKGITRLLQERRSMQAIADNALFWGVHDGNLERVRGALDLGADPDTDVASLGLEITSSKQPRNQDTLLIYAARFGSPDIMNEFLNRRWRCGWMETNAAGHNAYLAAISAKNMPVVELLGTDQRHPSDAMKIRDREGYDDNTMPASNSMKELIALCHSQREQVMNDSDIAQLPTIAPNHLPNWVKRSSRPDYVEETAFCKLPAVAKWAKEMMNAEGEMTKEGERDTQADNQVLFYAVAECNLPHMKEVLNDNANPDALLSELGIDEKCMRNYLRRAPLIGETILHATAEFDKGGELIGEMIHRSAPDAYFPRNINWWARDENGHTPYLRAAAAGNVNAVLRIAQAKELPPALLNARDHNGQDALALLGDRISGPQRMQFQDTISYRLEGLRRVNQALMVAVANDNPDRVNECLQNGADVNAPLVSLGMRPAMLFRINGGEPDEKTTILDIALQRRPMKALSAIYAHPNRCNCSQERLADIHGPYRYINQRGSGPELTL